MVGPCRHTMGYPLHMNEWPSFPVLSSTVFRSREQDVGHPTHFQAEGTEAAQLTSQLTPCPFPSLQSTLSSQQRDLTVSCGPDGTLIMLDLSCLIACVHSICWAPTHIQDINPHHKIFICYPFYLLPALDHCSKHLPIQNALSVIHSTSHVQGGSPIWKKTFLSPANPSAFPYLQSMFCLSSLQMVCTLSLYQMFFLFDIYKT